MKVSLHELIKPLDCAGQDIIPCHATTPMSSNPTPHEDPSVRRRGRNMTRSERNRRNKESKRKRRKLEAEDGTEEDKENIFWYFLCTRYFHRPT
jgi:hypothetical protein